jgi:uncharacterized protein YecT (DUF1311 family)
MQKTHNSSNEAKKAKWFSCRHRTSEASRETRSARQKKDDAKLNGAYRRQKASVQRTPQQQLRQLDERLGVGVGAKKERARLQALIG